MKILHGGEPCDNLLHLKAIAECLGIPAELFNVDTTPSLLISMREQIENGCSGLVLDVVSLKRQLCSPDQLQGVADTIRDTKAAVLLLVTGGDEAVSGFVETLSGTRVSKVNQLVDATKVTFPTSGKDFSRELSCQQFARSPKEAWTLTLREGAEISAVMNLDGAPAFAHWRAGGAAKFVWSTPQVFDVHRPLGAEIEFELASEEYLPAIIFLRSAFGEQAWHNPGAGAGFVIDDPLLRKKYGFIDFEKLLSSARKHAYHVTLAFIPWNYWRSRSRQVRMFLDHQESFSICVHGCDHTRNEYGLPDYAGLLRKNFVAIERMKIHARRTGLEAEALMVFPQEKYSIEAMRALSDSRQYLAAVCTACMPRNLVKPMLRGADLLLPAQDSFYGFPVFKRFYWGDMSVFALALFLGKPAILVEHHKFLRSGPAGPDEFTELLAELRPDLRWRSLSETVKRTHARRRLPDGTYEVRFFTDRFTLEHQLEKPATYRLLRRVPETSTVNRVLVRGESVPFSRLDGFLMFEAHAHHPEALAVSVEVEPILPAERYPTGIKYHTSVALRRILSELRDSFAARKPDRRRRAGVDHQTKH